MDGTWASHIYKKLSELNNILTMQRGDKLMREAHEAQIISEDVYAAYLRGNIRNLGLNVKFEDK